MKTEPRVDRLKTDGKRKKFTGNLHINADFETAIQVMAGSKKPTKGMLKIELATTEAE